jgi:hypothetical protein
VLKKVPELRSGAFRQKKALVLTMVYCTWNTHDFGHYPSSNFLKNTTFWKLDIFSSSGKIMNPVIEAMRPNRAEP